MRARTRAQIDVSETQIVHPRRSERAADRVSDERATGDLA
jgi:hypothetical protein